MKDLIPCLHFSENFKNLENLGGVKWKHLLEIQNTLPDSLPYTTVRTVRAAGPTRTPLFPAHVRAAGDQTSRLDSPTRNVRAAGD